MNIDPTHNNQKINRTTSEELIVGYATQLIFEGNGQAQVEDICQRLNEDLNNPPLQPEAVNAIIKKLLPRTARQKVISNLGVDFSLNSGSINYTENSPARTFLFGNDVIPMDTVSVIGGLGGSGKSMAMVEMIGAAAIGGTYANRK